MYSNLFCVILFIAWTNRRQGQSTSDYFSFYRHCWNYWIFVNMYTFSVISADDSVALRLYLGMEYECPRGHRFFCSSPDKIFKAPSSGIFKVVLYFNFYVLYSINQWAYSFYFERIQMHVKEKCSCLHFRKVHTKL